jgi:O-antigen ligase
MHSVTDNPPRSAALQYPVPVTASPHTPPRSQAAALESLAAAILCVAIVAGPLALGGTPAWVRFGLEAAMATAAILWAVARPRPVTSLIIPLAIAALVLAQLVPLPDRLLTAIAPVSAGAWKVAHEGLPEAWGRISITPAASAAAARRVLLAVATILVVAHVSRDPRRRRWLYTALAAAGVLVWAAAFAFPVNPKDRAVYGVYSLRGPIEFWKTPERPPRQTGGFGSQDWVTIGDERYQADSWFPGDGFGPYIYSNHFANAVALTLPAICGLFVVFAGRWVPRWAGLLGAALVIAAAAATTGIMAGSRAGTGSLVLGGVVFLSLAVKNRWLAWAWGGLAAIAVGALLAFVAVFHGPFEPPAELVPDAWEPLVARLFKDARIDAARIAERMFLASPVLGTGLGSYGDLFPRFVTRDHLMYFAHNDFVQLLAEGGLAGVVVIIAAGSGLVARLVRFCRERRPGNRVVDAAAWAALAAGLAHSIFDWNMHAPANALLACVIVGLALSSVVPRRPQDVGRAWAWPGRLLASLFVAAVLAALGLLARDAATERPVRKLQEAITAARLAKSPEARARAVERLVPAIAAGESAMPSARGHWRLPMLLGQATLHLAHAVSEGSSTFHQPDAAAGAAARKAAKNWFQVAGLASPARRGLPEPVPPNANKRKSE